MSIRPIVRPQPDDANTRKCSEFIDGGQRAEMTCLCYNRSQYHDEFQGCLMKHLLRVFFFLAAALLSAPLASIVEAQPLVDNPNGTYYTYSNFRQFQNGFMIWRSNNGTIDVFRNDGTVRSYLLSSYGNLPLPGTPPPPPNGLFTPSFGMARLWYNFLDVQQALGWATDAAETGYNIFFQTPSFGSFFTLTRPDNTLIRVNLDGTWSSIATTPTATASPIATFTPSATASGAEQQVGTTHQVFEGGFMLWRADSGDIWVFLNTGSTTGEITVLPNALYATLPIDRQTPLPAGRLRPENGFGRVWSNFTLVRQRLGWATSAEQGYLMLTRTLPNGDTWSFSLPDGRFVSQTSGRTWIIEGAAPPSVTPMPTATQGAAANGMVTVDMVYQGFERGEMLWRADTGTIYAFFQDTGQLTTYEAAVYGRLPIDRVSPPPSGLIRPDNGFGRVWSNIPEVRNGLGWADTNEFGYTASLTFDGGALTGISLPPDDLYGLVRADDGLWSRRPLTP